jgi:hypothetical protein
MMMQVFERRFPHASPPEQNPQFPPQPPPIPLDNKALRLLQKTLPLQNLRLKLD